MKKIVLFLITTISLFLLSSSWANATLSETIKKIKPSLVGVGTYSRVRDQNIRFLGTGFAIMNGQYIATNAHVIPDVMDTENNEKLIVLTGNGAHPHIQDAEVAAINPVYDIAIIKIAGHPLKPLKLSNMNVEEGESIAFTGFPIGTVLGLYPVTHHGIISCITPIVIPARSSQELTVKQIQMLRHPYFVYQLDATAYPGNSGSPVYNPLTGDVIAVVNKVLVKGTKETILTHPSAITYAIPIAHLQSLIKTMK